MPERAPLVELRELSRALLAHAEWQEACGASGLAPCDAALLEERRERYRALVQLEAADETSRDEAPQAQAPQTEPPQTEPHDDSPYAKGTDATRHEAPSPSRALPPTDTRFREAPPRDVQGLDHKINDAPARGDRLLSAEHRATPDDERAFEQPQAFEQNPPRESRPGGEGADAARPAQRPARNFDRDAHVQPQAAEAARPPSASTTRTQSATAHTERARDRSGKPEESASRAQTRSAERDGSDAPLMDASWESTLPPLAFSEDTRRRLQMLDEEVKSCTRCMLHETRTQTVFARGSGRSGVCFVGEGPGADEDAQGYPFVGAAGQLLDKMIAAMGFDRDDVYVCNIVKCRPPKNRKPEQSEMNACREYLQEQLELIQPRVIVALGATAVTGLMGLTMGITRLRGQWRLYRGEIPVMPTFHPAYLLRQPSAKRQVWEDLQQVLKHVGLTAPARQR